MKCFSEERLLFIFVLLVAKGKCCIYREMERVADKFPLPFEKLMNFTDNVLIQNNSKISVFVSEKLTYFISSKMKKRDWFVSSNLHSPIT